MIWLCICQFDKYSLYDCVPEFRVTRLGEFSPVGLLFTFHNFFNFRSNTQSLATFSTVQVMHYFWQNTSWATFWANFFTNSSGHPVPDVFVPFRKRRLEKVKDHVTWDRCYDFLNIFAEKLSKKLAFLSQNKA
jgi:hypothetical protein